MGYVAWSCFLMAGLLAQVKVENKKPPRPGSVVTMYSFDQDEAGRAPEAWEEKTGAVWKVVAEETAPSPPHVLTVLAGEEHAEAFNLVLAKEPRARVFHVSARIKPISGKEDQGGGIVWRAVDEKNYYLARINPLEHNFRVYKVVDGVRTQLGSVEVQAGAGEWHTMQIISLGTTFLCTVNRTWTLQFSDRTFPEAGRFGLWTKADAVTAFDDVEIIVQDKLELGKP